MNFKYFGYFVLALLLSGCKYNLPEELEVAYTDLPENIDFNYHVKPILSDRCYACHGPDENTRKAGLRLDIEEFAFQILQSGNTAFVRGNPDDSECIQRILSDDPELQMPPPESNLSLTKREKALLIKWVEQGAKWKKHWAFLKPMKQAVPSRINEDWPYQNEIDGFVQAKLITKKFFPLPETEKEKLIRRVTMDLTGLPPTIEEIDAFLKDPSDDAYEKVVDRLLQTDAHAERLTLDWLDLARYADSHGLHADGARLMWPWRDWVINAFKENMPYDQFVTWQLAGDLFTNPSREQKLATAFNRNHPMTAEGGAIEEEFRLNYVFDRTETVSTAFMGLTVACARCHDHKFDPISQKDYFEMSAFFNNVKELGMTGDDGNYGPMLALPNKNTEAKLNDLQNEIAKKEKELGLTKDELAQLEEYIKTLPDSFIENGKLDYYPLDKLANSNKGHIADQNKNATTREAPKVVDGIKGNAFLFNGEYDELYLHNIPNFEWMDSFSGSLWIQTTKRDSAKTQTIMGTSGDKNNFWRGWDFYLDGSNRLNARLIHSQPHNYIHVRSKDSIKTNEWNHVAFTYTGSSKAKDLNLFINGEETDSEIVFDNLYKSIRTIRSGDHSAYHAPVRVAKSYRSFTGENGIFLGKIDEIRLFNRGLSPIEIKRLASLQNETDTPPIDKTYWIQQSDAVQNLEKELRTLRADWLTAMEPVMEVMVMEEIPTKRKAFLYDRGNYDQPTQEVEANTLSILPEFSDDLPKNRLGLSKWLFSKEHPLTARVTVNRYWQLLFGKGLVDTPTDFGVQGSLPSHPELLDWLAISFMDSDWDVRALLKKMVMSHTYRQTSKVSEELWQNDPENIYLARSNTYRLPAELIRDNALAASGLLVPTVGGKSVKPYQPVDLWIEKTSFSHELMRYKETKGDSLYRRSLYTFVRRTQPHPAMIAFDAPSREVCTISRENTNTPLQALVLLNDKQFVEASRVLAERIQKEAGDTLDKQITHAFRLATSRRPKKEELQLLKEFYEQQKKRFQKNPTEATKLLSVGEKIVDNSLDITKTAALTMVTNTLLNHDEAYTKR
ncbi:DUF1553 domain-containing protein [Maribacter algicola]|uniref:DUF1553 domain-containing protein n=1 Tax=Maribacter algicola TaxID=2498892 RepID=A0A3R8Q0S1_9FLAO|nr:DUF1553 domain-containing protein [Maribacter algicola]RRQ47433.1 DUF1553 domain-containing protein [Maribacter algicola]